MCVSPDLGRIPFGDTHACGEHVPTEGMDIGRASPQVKPVTDAPPSGAKQKRYALAFLTDQWQWEADLAVGTLGEAKAAAREALERVVREETPELACVTLFEDDRKIGVWDWVEKQAHWTPL